MSRYPVQWCGGPVPSHLTQAQVSRLLGISPAAVADRCHNGQSFSLVTILGTQMVPVADLVVHGLLSLPDAVSFPQR
jgi:hypothetical protein